MQQRNNDLNEPKNNNKKPDIKKLLIVGAFAVVAAIFASMGILHFLLKDDAPKNLKHEISETAPQQTPKDIAKDDNPQAHGLDKRSVMDAVALSLFDNGLDNSSIKESTEEKDGNVLKLHIIIDQGDADLKALKETIADRIKAMGTEPEIGSAVSFESGNLSAVIDFIERKAEKPVEKKPVVKRNYGGVKVAFVIDDCGYSIPLAEKLGKVKAPLAMAIIPYTPHSKETADVFRRLGKTVLLHQPMEPKSYPTNDPGKGAVLLNMPESLVDISLRKNVEDLGGKIDGFNNHMGSGLTESREKMRQVFAVMKNYTDFYVDSYTSPKTVAYDECQKAGLTCAINNKFIDNESDPEYIRGKIMDGVNLAKANGSIIMIGHLREATVNVLVQILPELEAMGVDIVPVRELAGR
jgi:polysaccharide deacetylase 2 family uncharacterized protein YibQ